MKLGSLVTAAITVGKISAAAGAPTPPPAPPPLLPLTWRDAHTIEPLLKGRRALCFEPKKEQVLICRLGSTTMSFKIMEKSSSNLVVEEQNGDLPGSTSYGKAMEALSSLITRQKRGDKSNIGGKYGKLERMEMYLQILGLEEQIAGLKIIHVAGTKGKGSTCASCEAILRQCGLRTGFVTSPHLIDIRERFRIHG
ncbi:Folylpolyglutamate synthase-like protein, partial [Drosera capensis]